MTEGGPIAGPSAPADKVLSPGLAARSGLGAACELKFRLDAAGATAMESWARQHLNPDLATEVFSLVLVEQYNLVLDKDPETPKLLD